MHRFKERSLDCFRIAETYGYLWKFRQKRPILSTINDKEIILPTKKEKPVLRCEVLLFELVSEPA